MSLRYMYITNDPYTAKVLDKIGVDLVWVDLETLGKEERQGEMDCVKSHHTVQDVKAVKNVLTKSQLLVRINPINPESEQEINQVIANGADIIMLPMFKTVREVGRFLDYVSGRVETMLLVETKEAVEVLNDILFLKGIDSVHIGLNDLHLSYKKKFMFELLADETVSNICQIIKKHGIPYGFGGVAKLGNGMVPAEFILSEHYRLGSSQVILSRSFCKPEDYKSQEIFSQIFQDEMEKIKRFEAELEIAGESFFQKNRLAVKRTVQNYIISI